MPWRARTAGRSTVPAGPPPGSAGRGGRAGPVASAARAQTRPPYSTASVPRPPGGASGVRRPPSPEPVRGSAPRPATPARRRRARRGGRLREHGGAGHPVRGQRVGAPHGERGPARVRRVRRGCRGQPVRPSLERVRHQGRPARPAPPGHSAAQSSVDSSPPASQSARRGSEGAGTFRPPATSRARAASSPVSRTTSRARWVSARRPDCRVQATASRAGPRARTRRGPREPRRGGGAPRVSPRTAARRRRSRRVRPCRPASGAARAPPSRITWALLPPNPNALTAARRGAPPSWAGHGTARPATARGVPSREMCGLSRVKPGVPGSARTAAPAPP